MQANADQVVRRSSDLAVVDSGERIAVLNLDRLAQPPAVLEGTAVAIWRALDEAGTLRQVAARVAESYGVDPDEIADDVSRFVADLAELGLVHPGTPADVQD